MPDAAPQTYATHRRYVPLYHFVTPTILLLNLLWTFVGIYHAWRGGGRFDRCNSVIQVLVAVALLLIWFYARSFALAVQDRVIRQEMWLRLGELLPLDQRARIPQLSAAQLIALRFASDSDVPGLVEKALGSGMSPREIKQAIVSWRPDYFRV